MSTSDDSVNSTPIEGAASDESTQATTGLQRFTDPLALYPFDEVHDFVMQNSFYGTAVYEMRDGIVVREYFVNPQGDWLVGPLPLTDARRDEARAKGAVFRSNAMKFPACVSCPRAEVGTFHPGDALVLGTRATQHEPCEILFVFSQPDFGSRERGTGRPVGLAGLPGDMRSAFQRAITEITREIPTFGNRTISVAYSAMCSSPIEDDKPSAAVLHACRPNLFDQIAHMNPKMIIACGSASLKQLGVQQGFNNVRGRVLEPDVTALPAPLFVTFSEKAIAAAPGLFRTFLQDMRNVERRLSTGIYARPLEELAENYKLPETIDEALAVIEEIEGYSSLAHVAPKDWWISVDTETTSLHPHKEGAKVIAFCIGWDDGKAATFIYDHPLADPTYLARLPELTESLRRLLGSTKPKTFHNAKFDLKWIELNVGIFVANVKWCSLLGEHLLDEDKKGNYGLKALTAVWLPHFCGYEDKLYDILVAQESGEVDKVLAIIETLPSDQQAYAEALTGYLDELAAYQEQREEHEQLEDTYNAELTAYKLRKSLHKSALEAWAARPKRPTKPVKPKQPKGVDVLDDAYVAFAADLEAYDKAVAAWEAWPVAPPKPIFDEDAPDKPARLERPPEKPEDPRSKKEREFNTDAGFERVPLRELQLYGAVDCDVTRQLTKAQRMHISTEHKKLTAKNPKIFKVSPAGLMESHAIPASRVLGHMEFYGVKIDTAYAPKLRVSLDTLVASSDAALRGMAAGYTHNGDEFNPASGAHIANILYDRGWKHPTAGWQDAVPCLERTKKTKKPATTEKALKPYLKYDETPGPDGKMVKTIRPESYFIEQKFLYGKATKARDTFLANAEILSKMTGNIHTSFLLNGTGTGRLSSANMNLQNLPKKIAGHSLKTLFIPDSDAFIIANCDYKGAEVRVFTVYASDPALIKALNDGMDMHSFFAHKTFNLPYEDFQLRESDTSGLSLEYRAQLDKLRTQIKRVVFGILYGAGPSKIAETIGADIEDAKAIIGLLFSMFPAIKRYIDETNAEVVAYGYVETVFGRRRRFPLVASERHKARAQRQAGNFKIQSTSSDIVIGQLIEMHEMIFSEKTWSEWGIHRPLHTYGVRLLLTVHDSIVLQWPKEIITALKPWMTYYGTDRVREKYPWLPVPFTMDIECGPSYGECMPVDKYLAMHAMDNASNDVTQPAANDTTGPTASNAVDDLEDEDLMMTELREDAFTGGDQATG